MESQDSRVTIPALQQMKRDGRKIVGVVAWDCQIAQIVDRVGMDIVSVGDSVGMNLWGRANPLEVTLDEMLVVCKAVRRGVKRALLSCDFPFGPLQEGTDSAVKAAVLLTEKGGADMVKLDGAADFPDAVRAIVRAGIPVFAQFGITPQTAQQYGLPPGDAFKPGARVPAEMTAKLVEEAKRLEEAALLCSTSPTPALLRGRRSRRLFRFRCSEDSEAAPGWTDACVWFMLQSDTQRATWIRTRRIMPMWRRLLLRP
jgi:3-methyl-2-oxobutanoate hydroxymethyltransferase